MKYGTNHFTSRLAAIEYYARQDIGHETVDERLAEGEIFIGAPEAKAGESVRVDLAEGRYWIHESSTAKVHLPKGFPTDAEIDGILADIAKIGPGKLPAYKALRLLLYAHPRICGVDMVNSLDVRDRMLIHKAAVHAAWIGTDLI
jgi:hypothetical protein